MKKALVIVVVVLILLAGLGLILYPTLGDYYNRIHRSDAIVAYKEQISAFDDRAFSDMWDRAVRYNEQLYDTTKGIEPKPEDRIEYDSVLNVTKDGMMAYIDIPKIKCHLPLYHGTDEGTLQSNAGHIDTSSLPVGGKNTHCVISGHTGLPSAKLFTNLETLTTGDTFMLTTLGEILTYEVDQILVVLPWEMDSLKIVPDMDYCTLVTCTPYGVNSHRLLVRGHRIPTTTIIEEEVHVFQEAQERDLKTPFIIACGAAVIIVLVVLALIIVKKMIANNRENEAMAEKKDSVRKGSKT